MGEAYLAFAERQPALYNVIFSARRPKGRSGPTANAPTDRAAAFDGLVALVEAVTAAADARRTAILVWSALHGFATLRASGSPIAFPRAEAYVAQVLETMLD